jgi:hypothetical protein
MDLRTRKRTSVWFLWYSNLCRIYIKEAVEPLVSMILSDDDALSEYPELS